MSKDADRPRNPRRVAAGRANRQKRGPLTEEGRARLSEAARRHRPWEHATGPRTAAGRAQAARNGRCRCRQRAIQPSPCGFAGRLRNRAETRRSKRLAWAQVAAGTGERTPDTISLIRDKLAASRAAPMPLHEDYGGVNIKSRRASVCHQPSIGRRSQARSRQCCSTPAHQRNGLCWA